MLLRSPQPLREHATNVGCLLLEWAARTPARVFLAERAPRDGWRTVSYAEAARAATLPHSIASKLAHTTALLEEVAAAGTHKR